jgi:hypothetical protein
LHVQISSGDPLEAWQVASLQRYWHAYHEHVLEHHRYTQMTGNKAKGHCVNSSLLLKASLCGTSALACRNRDKMR